MNHPDELNHLQARKVLQLALDGHLDDDQVKALDQHLAVCGDCRAYALGMTKLDKQLRQSLQLRWPQTNPNETKMASTLAEIQPQVRKNQMKTRFSRTILNLGWVALAILLVASLAWTIKTLAPIPTQGPAGESSPEVTEAVLQPSEAPLPTVQVTQEPTLTPITSPLPSGTVSLFPNVAFTFASEFPSSPELVTVYQQQLSEAVTEETARQVATQWGIAGGVYSSPSEGMNDVIFDVMDGSRSMRFLNFPDQFIYQVGYVSPDYGSALMDSGPLPSFEEQVAIATNFLQPLGILDLPYQAMPLETERGMVAFIPMLDGLSVIQEIGVDRSNIGWIDVKVNTAGQVTMVEYSHHDFQPIGEYPILNAQQAWDRFSKDVDLQHSRYAILSPERNNTYQAWVRSYQPGQQIDIYGWVNAYQPTDPSLPSLVMINNLPVIGDTASMIPANRYDVRFVHAWGQIEGSSTDGIGLSLAGWEVSPLADEYITGTLATQSGQTQLVAINRIYTLIDPPSDISEGTLVGIQGVVLDGDPAMLDWKFIETGEIPFTYGASNSCGGGGGGGGGSLNADFGAGGFAYPNFDNQTAPIATDVVSPYQPGDEINAATGTIYVTQHLYLGGRTSSEVNFWPDASAGLSPDWSYSLTGENLSEIDQYQQLPIRVWGQVDRLENGIIYITVNRYEPEYPGVQIQEWSGTEQIVTLDGQEVVRFTTSNGENYVLKSSIDWGAEGNIIGILGNLIEIEGYVIPDQFVGGYLVLKDTAGSTQPDGVVTSSLVNVWDHSQDPSSNPGAVLQGQVTIDTIELAYDAINLDRCQASAAQDPNMSSWLVVQPMWVYNGHFDDGRRFIVQVQALPDEYLR
jgi:Putative zinc-finger